MHGIRVTHSSNSQTNCPLARARVRVTVRKKFGEPAGVHGVPSLKGVRVILSVRAQFLWWACAHAAQGEEATDIKEQPYRYR